MYVTMASGKSFKQPCSPPSILQMRVLCHTGFAPVESFCFGRGVERCVTPSSPAASNASNRNLSHAARAPQPRRRQKPPAQPQTPFGCMRPPPGPPQQPPPPLHAIAACLFCVPLQSSRPLLLPCCPRYPPCSQPIPPLSPPQPLRRSSAKCALTCFQARVTALLPTSSLMLSHHG